jgi:hypothetical protein
LTAATPPRLNRGHVTSTERPGPDIEQQPAIAPERAGGAAAVRAPAAITAAGNQAVARSLAEDPPPAALRGLVANRGANRAVARLAAQQLMRRTDMEIEARETMRSIEERVRGALTTYAGNPDGMATFLLSPQTDWEEQQIRWRTASRANDAALLAVVRAAGDAASIRRLGAVKPTGGVLMTVGRRLRANGHVPEAERIIGALVSTAHAHLLGETAVAAAGVQSALAPHGATVQSITGGSDTIVYDEYSIVMDAMPTGVTPEAFLHEMSLDLNRAVNNPDFDDINVFARTAADKARGAPALGDVYDIDIKGPDNGSVMLVEAASNHFIFQTVTVPQTGTHPESGSREFGFERLDGGAVRYYTRGVSSPSSELTGIIGGPIQEKGWTAMLTGIGNTLARRGGVLRPGSFTHWIRRG